VGDDGILGVPGELETHDSRAIAMAGLTAVTKEAAALAGLAQSNFAAVYSGGGTPPGSGVRSGLDLITQHYLEQARGLMPTLVVKAQQVGYVVLTEGFALDGYPTQAVLTQGGGR
jgi:hypothetical protein